MKYEPIIYVSAGILPTIKAKGWTKIAKKIEKKGSGIYFYSFKINSCIQKIIVAFI